MSKHSLERIFQRYGREFKFGDLAVIIKAIQHRRCYILDAAKEDAILVLVNYNHIPMKLVYSPGRDHKGIIVTALPLDIDEYNEYIGQIPLIEPWKKRYKKKQNP